MVGDAQVNCHFFVEDEIEFDLDPREVTGPNQVEAIVGFMTLLGDVTGKAVTLTMENTPEAVIFRRLPGRQSVEWVGNLVVRRLSPRT